MRFGLNGLTKTKEWKCPAEESPSSNGVRRCATVVYGPWQILAARVLMELRFRLRPKVRWFEMVR
jgi:hypothetical protein